LETQIVECGYTPDFFRQSNPRDCVKIIRGYKRRQYEFYRVAAFHISYMAQFLAGKHARKFSMDIIMPPYDELDLTPEQKKEWDTYKAKKRFEERMKKYGRT
jgi:hypothetical protein